MSSKQDSAPRAEPPAVTAYDGAFVLPTTKRRLRNNYAVLDAAGARIAAADTFRGGPLNFSEGRVAPARCTELSGAHYFGGLLFQHFGHIFVESTARLHAFPALRDRIASVVFVGIAAGQTEIGRFGSMFETLGIDRPLNLITEPTRVERLYVPEQLGGIGDHAAGAPPLHRFFAEASARFDARGPERIFISRAGYRLMRGGVISEDLLEANMAAQGYTLFAPEQHSLADQIATYRSARFILGLDSSAFHVVAASCNSAAKIGIILRRKSTVDDIAPHVEGFTGRKPVIFDAIRRVWSDADAELHSWEQYAELDFAELGRALQGEGFIGDLEAWRPAGPRMRAGFRKRMVKRTGKTLTQSDETI